MLLWPAVKDEVTRNGQLLQVQVQVQVQVQAQVQVQVQVQGILNT